MQCSCKAQVAEQGSFHKKNPLTTTLLFGFFSGGGLLGFCMPLCYGQVTGTLSKSLPFRALKEYACERMHEEVIYNSDWYPRKNKLHFSNIIEGKTF